MARPTIHNNIFSQEIWDNVNRENKRLLKDFLMYKRSSDKSSETLFQYEQMIRLFFCWNYSNNDDKFFVDMKKRDFIKFFDSMVVEMHWSPNRVATVKSTLSSLSNYIENILDDEYPVYKNIISKIEIGIKQPVREKTILSEEEIITCLDRLLEDGKYQVACYLALAFASGARKSELLEFKMSFFDESNIILDCLYKTPKIRTKGRSSRGKMLNKYVFRKYFDKYYYAWLDYRRLNHVDSDYLFVVNHDGEWKKAEVSSTTSWVKTIERYLGKPFYSHACRHALCTMLRSSGLPDKVIQHFFGWSNLDMLNTYDDSPDDSDFGKYFGKDGITVEQKNLEDM